MRAILLLTVLSSTLTLGCALDSEGQAQTDSSGGSGGADSAATGGTAGTGASGSGGSSPVDASWPGDAAAGMGGAQPEDAAGDAPGDVTLDAKLDVAPEGGVESDCTNGLDDDGDGLPDCADPDCGAIVACVPASPAGWTGPSFVRIRAAAEAATDCGSMTQGDSYYAGLMAGGHTCACTCGGPSGGTCGNSSASLYANSDCTSAGHSSVSGTGCFGLSASTGTASAGSVLATEPPVQTPPTCTPYANPTVGNVSWNQALDTCQVAASTGCDVGEACVPLPPAEMEQTACVLRVGDLACPAAFASKRTFFEDSEDNRECSAAGCACAAAVGAKCGGKVRVHSTADCSLTVGSFDLDGTCHAITTMSKVEALELAPGGTHGGTCASSGAGTPTGSVSPTGTHTLCCTAGL